MLCGGNVLLASFQLLAAHTGNRFPIQQRQSNYWYILCVCVCVCPYDFRIMLCLWTSTILLQVAESSQASCHYHALTQTTRVILHWERFYFEVGIFTTFSLYYRHAQHSYSYLDYLPSHAHTKNPQAYIIIMIINFLFYFHRGT